jgi:hypothetical protein
MNESCKKAIDNLRGKIPFILAFIIIFIYAFVASPLYAQNGFWLKGDFHIHTTMSDGDMTPAEIAKYSFEEFGLDAIAITDHGGHFFRVNDDFLRIDDKGNVFSIKNYDTLIATGARQFKNYSRTIQLLEKSFPEVIRLRKKYPNKLVIQGVEWNIPGHDHGDIGILSETGTAISNFNYMFDRKDTLSTWKAEFKKQNANRHQNSLVALNYLQNRYPDESYFIVNHPSRMLQYTISDFRDFINTAPKIAVGFEGLPGHQKVQGSRCKYDFELGDGINYHSKTYGGADFMLAKVGGLWDALLGEGRRFWVFTNSDFHRPSEDSWPGEYSKNYIWVDDTSYKSLIKGMRKGKIFVATGGLISDLNFTAEANGTAAEMGESLKAVKGSIVTIKIGFKSIIKNYNEDSVKVDHIDLISGDVAGMVPPESGEYNMPFNRSTKILKRYSIGDWEKGSDGFSYFTYSFKAEHSQYFRLRGTNISVNTKNEIDENGNPLCDVLVGDNNEKDAWKDLWFYSNPIFIEVIN